MKRRIAAVFLCIIVVLFLSSCSVESVAEEVAQPTTEAGLSVLFIDVGQGDAALVQCNGAVMLIDGGKADQSSKLYSILKRKGIDYIDILVATHPDADHIGGLPGALQAARAGTVYCSTTEHTTKTFQTFKRKAEEQGVEIAVPVAGEVWSLGEARIQVVGPVSNSGDTNNNSIVLRLEYKSNTFLFTGDAEREEEAEILAAGYNLSADVLKVGHHGSDNSTSYPFLREVMPRYAVISVGKGNSYGHPREGTLSKLRDADVEVYRTDMQGDILVTSDGETVTVGPARNGDVQTNPTEPGRDVENGTGAESPDGDTTREDGEVRPGDDGGGGGSDGGAGVTAPEGGYIGNKKTKKFHLPSCVSLPSEGNRVVLPTREEAVAGGYSPCGRCHP